MQSGRKKNAFSGSTGKHVNLLSSRPDPFFNRETIPSLYRPALLS